MMTFLEFVERMQEKQDNYDKKFMNNIPDDELTKELKSLTKQQIKTLYAYTKGASGEMNKIDSIFINTEYNISDITLQMKNGKTFHVSINRNGKLYNDKE